MQRGTIAILLLVRLPIVQVGIYASVLLVRLPIMQGGTYTIMSTCQVTYHAGRDLHYSVYLSGYLSRRAGLTLFCLLFRLPIMQGETYTILSTCQVAYRAGRDIHILCADHRHHEPGEVVLSVLRRP